MTTLAEQFIKVPTMSDEELLEFDKQINGFLKLLKYNKFQLNEVQKDWKKPVQHNVDVF